MANIIKQLTARVEDYYTTNKKPCKLYKTEEAAEFATSNMAQAAANYFLRHEIGTDAASADYVVFYVESIGKWVGAINLSELLRRPESTGGYLGFCKGFYTW